MKTVFDYPQRFLTNEQAAEKQSDEWIAADLHVHSSCSYDVLPSPDLHPEAIYQKAYDNGLGFITITDHDTMDAYDIIGWERERLVTGVEITLLDRIRVGHTIHVNVYGLNKEQFNELLNIAQKDANIINFIEFLQEEKLSYVYNHPFWFPSGEKANYKAVEEIVELFPVIEYNMKRVKKKNMLAMWLAYKYSKGIVANTDTHIAELGKAFNLSKGETFKEYFANIVQGESYIVPNDLTNKTLNFEITRWAEILFELDESVGYSKYTGIGWVDSVINFFANNTYETHPHIFRSVDLFLHHFLKTQIVSFCYLSSQNRKARAIRKELQIPNLI